MADDCMLWEMRASLLVNQTRRAQKSFTPDRRRWQIRIQDRFPVCDVSYLASPASKEPSTVRPIDGGV